MEKGTATAEYSQFKDMRRLCEMMRKLGYSRIISLESFKKPNFQLVAEILDFLAMRIDPSADIPQNIDTMNDRIKFMKAVCGVITSKARIKISPINLYHSDYHAVPELIKIASMLYGVYTSQNATTEYSRQTFSIPVKYDKNVVRNTASDIVEIGQRVFELLSKEDGLKDKRKDAIKFIEKLSKNYSGEEHAYIKECVEKLINQQKESVDAMESYVKNLREDERTLEEKIKRKNLDIERANKRLVGMSVKPAYMQDMEDREKELERLYAVYLDKFRNLDHLNHLVDIYNAKESEKREMEQTALLNLQKRLQNDEERMMNLDDRRRAPAPAQARGGGGQGRAMVGSLKDDVSNSL